jgi:hypothetical protein
MQLWLTTYAVVVCVFQQPQTQNEPAASYALQLYTTQSRRGHVDVEFVYKTVEKKKLQKSNVVFFEVFYRVFGRFSVSLSLYGDFKNTMQMQALPGKIS